MEKDILNYDLSGLNTEERKKFISCTLSDYNASSESSITDITLSENISEHEAYQMFPENYNNLVMTPRKESGKIEKNDNLNKMLLKLDNQQCIPAAEPRTCYPIGLGEKIPAFLQEWVFDHSRIRKTKPECEDFFYMLFLTKEEHDEWLVRSKNIPDSCITEFNILFAHELYERGQEI